MSHLTFESSVSDAACFDAPLQRGPLMRWQAKALEAGVKTLSINDSLVVSTPSTQRRTPSTLMLSPRTPGTAGRRNKVTPRKQHASKACKENHPVPNKLHINTTAENQQSNRPKSATLCKVPQSDRFIPMRCAMDMETSNHMLTKQTHKETQDPDNNHITADDASHPSAEYKQQISDLLGNGTESQAAGPGKKILRFNKPTPQAIGSNVNKVIYSCSSVKANRSARSRAIPKLPQRVMDAPELTDDYYLSLMDWSAKNVIALAISSCVFLWNATDGSIEQIGHMVPEDDYVSSVAWCQQGSYLAVGRSNNTIQLWDVATTKLTRTMDGHTGRVGCMDWNSHILTSGSRWGDIHHSDVRVANHQVGILRSHTQEVCQLRWNQGGNLLASGGNDNQLLLWDATLSMNQDCTPLHTLAEHNAAVKAIAWCPWKSSLLVSGGGTADRHIRFWSSATGSSIKSVDTHSQISDIVWNEHYRELISGHGFSQNQLSIWKYPSMNKVVDLKAHTGRVLGLCASPDGTTIASVAADETLMLWNCFEHDAAEGKKTDTTQHSRSAISMFKSIR